MPLALLSPSWGPPAPHLPPYQAIIRLLHMDSPSQETLAMSCITLLCPSATPSLISVTFLAPPPSKGVLKGVYDSWTELSKGRS